MIKFKIGKEAYEISNIKLRDLYMIRERSWYEGTAAAAGIVAHLSGCPEEDLKRLKPYQFVPLWNQVQELFAVKEDNPVHTEIRLNGKHYGLVHMDELTVGEIADAELIMHSSNADYRTHELLAILYRPVEGYWGKTYTIEEYDSKKAAARAEEFLELDLDIMRGATAFFFAIVQACTATIVNSLRREMEKSPKRVKEFQETLLKLLEPGTTSFTSARQRILSDLNKHLDSMLEQPLTSSLENETKPNDLRENTKK